MKSPSRTSSLFALPLGLALGLTGCAGDPGIDCSMEARSSVTVSVAGPEGAAPEGTSVQYSVDGGAFLDCDGTGSDWVCGWEVPGEFIIEISAPGHTSETRTLSVESDECHVISETLDVVLEEVVCDDSVEPSVLVELSSSLGEALPPGSRAWVAWSHANTDLEPLPCEFYDGNLWLCGWEEPGDIEISAGRIGMTSTTTLVTVEADECHVITEEIEMVLETSPTECDMQLVHSAIIQLEDPSGAPVEGASLEFTTPWEAWLMAEPCMDLGDGSYACGQEFVGPMDITMSADSFELVTESIFVFGDECHAQTENRTVTLEYLPD